MVRFILRSGRKSENDTMVFLTANDEVLNFTELLYILRFCFESEEDYYPVEQGYAGKAMLQAAITYIANGVSVEKVRRVFKLPYKPPAIIDQRVEYETSPQKIANETGLHELL
jgi:hypothetical protein